MIEFIEEHIETLHISTLAEFIDTAAIGQKRTSASKALVYLPGGKQSGVVFKGPYEWPKRAQLVVNTIFRAKLFGTHWAGACRVTQPVVVRFCENERYPTPPPCQVYFRMMHVVYRGGEYEGTYENIIGESQPRLVADKSKQGFMEFSKYLQEFETPPSKTQYDVAMRALVHFMHRAICYPVVGDSALRNVLVCTNSSGISPVGIDYEENRTGGDKARAEEEAGNVFAMMCGNRLWGRADIERLSGVLLERKEQILVHLRSIDLVWDKVEATLFDHGFTETQRKNAMENMQRRFNVMIRMVREFSAPPPPPVRKQRKRKAASAIITDDDNNEEQE